MNSKINEKELFVLINLLSNYTVGVATTSNYLGSYQIIFKEKLKINFCGLKSLIKKYWKFNEDELEKVIISNFWNILYINSLNHNFFIKNLKQKVSIVENRLIQIRPKSNFIDLKFKYNKQNIKYGKFEISYSSYWFNIYINLIIKRRYSDDFIERRLLALKPNELREKLNLFYNLKKL